jgi:peptide/nickel transport system substrate-binding protein
VETSVDRADLVRFFVPAPAVPMYRLLPPALLPQSPEPVRPSAPKVPAPPRTLTLLYDRAEEDHRAVAERLQVKLHDRGFRIALEPLSRRALYEKWNAQTYEVILLSVLHPPSAGPALALALELSGRHDLLGKELPAIGQLSDPPAREALSRTRADALLPALPIVPLYARALALGSASTVSHLTFDAHGIPRLDELFLVR